MRCYSLCVAGDACRNFLLVGVDSSLAPPPHVVLNVVFAQHVAGVLRHAVRGSAARHAACGHRALGPLVRAPLQQEAGLDASEVEVCEVMAGCPWTCVPAMKDYMINGDKAIDKKMEKRKKIGDPK